MGADWSSSWVPFPGLSGACDVMAAPSAGPGSGCPAHLVMSSTAGCEEAESVRMVLDTTAGREQGLTDQLIISLIDHISWLIDRPDQLIRD